METIIDDLYGGELVDYLRSIDVDNYQSPERIDKLLDLSFFAMVSSFENHWC